jgi:hypothetical protein
MGARDEGSYIARERFAHERDAHVSYSRVRCINETN